jgi:hypothetical protein
MQLPEAQTSKRLPLELVEILNWPHLVYELSRFQNGVWIFRGAGNRDFELLPKIGRKNTLSVMHREEKLAFTELEKRILQQFRSRAVAHIIGDRTDWEWLVIAQHHGVPTRLLDWTRNPFVAAFFALWDRDPDGNDCKVQDPWHDSDLTEEPYPLHAENVEERSRFEGDDCAVIYAWYAHEVLDIRNKRCPFEGYKKISLLNPPHVDQRIIAQDGVFTAFPDPKIALDQEKTRRLLIQKKDKVVFLKRLFRMGMHEAWLFPDLDGIARHLSWRLRNYIGIGGQTV